MIRNCKKTLKKYSFRKPRKKVGTNEQVGPILISDSEEEQERNDFQQQEEGPSQQEEPTQEQTQEKVQISNKKQNKRRIQQEMAINFRRKKVLTS